MNPDAFAQGSGQLDSVVHFIQLAIAPVFLLTAIGSMLGTMTNRVARIVDRAREIERRLAGSANSFGVSLVALITGLGLFLREIYVATATLRIGSR